MGWNAKPSGGYDIASIEAYENMVQIYNMLASTWTLESICGMLGNIAHESGFNPWRWQSDSVDLYGSKKGYGLAQFTPASGYIYNYGQGIIGYSPNLSTTKVTNGATAEDGYAQIICVDTDRAGKFINRINYCNYYDLSGTYPMSTYKQLTDLKKATIGWLFNYEFPAAEYRDEAHANLRYESAKKCYELLSGVTPVPEPNKGYITTTPTNLILNKGEEKEVIVQASGKWEYSYDDTVITVHSNSRGLIVIANNDVNTTTNINIWLSDNNSAKAIVIVSLNGHEINTPYINISPSSINAKAGETIVFDINSSDSWIFNIGRGGQVTAISENKIAVTVLKSKYKRIVLQVMLKNARNIYDVSVIRVLGGANGVLDNKMPFIYYLKPYYKKRKGGL